MKYTKEFDAETFPWWGGARDVAAEVRAADKLDMLTQHVEDVFEGEMPSETDINDYVWFGYREIEKALRIGDFDKDEED